MPTDDPLRDLIPSFTRPTLQEDLPEGPDLTSPGPGQSQDPPPWPPDPSRRPFLSTFGPDSSGDGAGTRTASSSAGTKPTAAQATALVIGLLGLAVAGVSWAVRARTGRKLRQPTKPQAHSIAEPLGRLLLRHADVSALGPDIADLLQAGSAAGAYLGDGPLLQGEAIDPGLPDFDDEGER